MADIDSISLRCSSRSMMGHQFKITTKDLGIFFLYKLLIMIAITLAVIVALSSAQSVFLNKFSSTNPSSQNTFERASILYGNDALSSIVQQWSILFYYFFFPAAAYYDY